jgi:dihydroorotate dehydrogenase
LDEIIDIVKDSNIAGVVASNTTIDRKGLKSVHQNETGGLSGKPLTQKSTEIIRYLHTKSNGAFPIIGVGGIMNERDAIEKLEALKTTLYIFTESDNAHIHKKSLEMLINTLKSEEYPKGELQAQAIEYYKKLSELREVDYFEIFPCLRCLYD